MGCKHAPCSLVQMHELDLLEEVFGWWWVQLWLFVLLFLKGFFKSTLFQIFICGIMNILWIAKFKIRNGIVNRNIIYWKLLFWRKKFNHKLPNKLKILIHPKSLTVSSLYPRLLFTHVSSISSRQAVCFNDCINWQWCTFMRLYVRPQLPHMFLNSNSFR